MRAFGFQIVRCGADGPATRATASEWNQRWQAVRKGDVAPDTITVEMISSWPAALEKKHGRGVGHKTLRGWRTFWKIMLGLKVA